MDKATMSAVLQLYAYKPWLSVVFYECWSMKGESDSTVHLLREGLHPDISHHVWRTALEPAPFWPLRSSYQHCLLTRLFLAAQ